MSNIEHIKGKKIGICFCGQIGRMTKHHWKPKGEKETSKQCLLICIDCHKKLHKNFTNDELLKMTLIEQINYLSK